MTYGPWPMLAWASEFVLESSGAWFAWRRRLPFLAAYLTFAAVSDALTFAILKTLGGNAYGLASWGTEAIGYVLLCALACQLAGKMLKEWRPVWWYAGFLSAGGATIVTGIFRDAPTWTEKFLNAELAASCYLGVLLLVGWVTKKGRLEAEWTLAGFGMICSVSGNAMCAMLSEHWSGALALYPIPAILSLCAWNAAGLKTFRLREARTTLGRSKPATMESDSMGRYWREAS